jgi:hypothetical protein
MSVTLEMTSQNYGAVESMNMRFGNPTLKQCKYGWMVFNGPYIGKCFELCG